MEQILAILVFGILGGISVFGYLSSERALSARGKRDQRTGRSDEDRPMAGVPGN